METSGRMTLLGSVINRIYVDSLDFPRAISNEHKCLFIVSVPYYNIFRKMYQERFGASPASFDELTPEHTVQGAMETYRIKERKAKKLLNYFRGNLLKILHNPDAVNTFLTENVKEEHFHSYTYDTIYKYLTGAGSVSAEDYLHALSKYRLSRTAITKWLKKKLENEEEISLKALRLQAWLQDKCDTDLLLFARGET
jgi:hypothetical protein